MNIETHSSVDTEIYQYWYFSLVCIVHTGVYIDIVLCVQRDFCEQTHWLYTYPPAERLSEDAWKDGCIYLVCFHLFGCQTAPRLYYYFMKKISHNISFFCHQCSLLITLYPPNTHTGCDTQWKDASSLNPSISDISSLLTVNIVANLWTQVLTAAAHSVLCAHALIDTTHTHQHFPC